MFNIETPSLRPVFRNVQELLPTYLPNAGHWRNGVETTDARLGLVGLGIWQGKQKQRLNPYSSRSVMNMSNTGVGHMLESWKDLPKEVASKLSYDHLE